MITIIIVTGIIVLGTCYGFYSEKVNWNGGVCRESGQCWEYFDSDSQGGKGYKDGMGNTHWVSYPGIDTKCFNRD